jgi:hypothetical protein
MRISIVALQKYPPAACLSPSLLSLHEKVRGLPAFEYNDGREIEAEKIKHRFYVNFA